MAGSGRTLEKLQHMPRNFLKTFSWRWELSASSIWWVFCQKHNSFDFLSLYTARNGVLFYVYGVVHEDA